MTGNTGSDDPSVSSDNPNPCFLISIIREISARNAERNSQKPFPIVGGIVIYPREK